MSDALERMKKKRGIVRTAVSKLLARMEEEASHEEYERNYDSLREMLSLLTTKEGQLMELDKDIEEKTLTEELDSELEYTQEYQDQIVRWKTRASILIQRNAGAWEESVSRRISAGSAGSDNSQGRQTVKLPRLVIEKFNGEISQWQEFWSQYDTAVHSNDVLCKKEKFTYLKSYLTGATAKAVAGFTLTDSNYDNAIDMLKNRFGRKDIVVSAHMSNLLTLTPVKRSSDIAALRFLYDECEIQIRSLESLGVHSDTYGALLCPVLLQLIPDDLALGYTRTLDTDGE